MQPTSDARPTSGVRPTSALVRRSRRAISSIAPVDRRSRRAISSIAPVDRRSRRAISSIAIVDRPGRSTIVPRDLVDRNHRSSIAPARSSLSLLSLSDLGFLFSLSLSLSLFFRKSFEVKMRGETDFRVKGEKIGQLEVIFRKMIFSVTAKHAEKGENDFLKSFSPKTNAP